MGLDMYLTGKKYVMPKYSDDDGRPDTRNKIGELFPDIKHPVDYVLFEVGYWRKTNSVHNWFVQNVQNGEDDCGEYHVTSDDLERLKAECVRALAGDRQAMEPVGGFFFGSTDRDEWYQQDLEHTLEIIDNALKFRKEHGEIYYSSSW